MRQSWDDYWLGIAAMVATRATCPKRSVGVVIVREQRIVSTGYNGAPAGEPHCLDVGCELEPDRTGKPHCIRTLHAEDNAVSMADPDRLWGATAYIHGAAPCYNCAKRLVNAGIGRVVTRDSDGPTKRDWAERTGPLLARAGVAVERRTLVEITTEPTGGRGG